MTGEHGTGDVDDDAEVAPVNRTLHQSILIINEASNLP